MIEFIFLFYIIAAFFGNLFLKSMSSAPLFILIIICIIYLFLTKNIKLPIESGKINKIFNIYTIIVLGYIILSFLGYIDLFDIPSLELRKSFILRQSYFIFCIPIAWVIYRIIVIKEKPFKFLEKFSIFIFLLLVIYNLITKAADPRILAIILPSLSLFIYYFKNKKIGLLFLVICLFVVSNGATDVLIKLVLISYVFFQFNLIKYLLRYYKLILVCLIVLLTFNGSSVVAWLTDVDINGWWRVVYWQHEFSILARTFFVGVGFGTPYCLDSIFSILTGGWNLAEGYSDITDTLYLTGQHSSFINAFYRLGIVGGTLFLYFNIVIFKNSYYISNRLSGDNIKLLKWAQFSFLISTISIAFNVGIESPRVFISYLIFTPILVALINKYDSNGFEYEKNMKKN